MDYSMRVNVPANTLASAPVRQNIKVDQGIIHEGWVFFPFGCNGYVHTQLWHGEAQILPITAGATYAGNGFPIPIKDRIEMRGYPEKLTLVAWSPGTTYAHNIDLRISLLPKEELDPQASFFDSFGTFVKSLGL